MHQHFWERHGPQGAEGQLTQLPCEVPEAFRDRFIRATGGLRPSRFRVIDHGANIRISGALGVHMKPRDRPGKSERSGRSLGPFAHIANHSSPGREGALTRDLSWSLTPVSSSNRPPQAPSKQGQRTPSSRRESGTSPAVPLLYKMAEALGRGVPGEEEGEARGDDPDIPNATG